MTKKVCLWCGVVDISRRPPGTLYCLDCAHAANVRSGASAAHQAVASAIRAGALKPANECVCVDCGAQAMDYDHRDYNRPLDVEPVCRSCNKKRGPAIPVGAPLYTYRQAKFVRPTPDAFVVRREAVHNPALRREELTHDTSEQVPA